MGQAGLVGADGAGEAGGAGSDGGGAGGACGGSGDGGCRLPPIPHTTTATTTTNKPAHTPPTHRPTHHTHHTTTTATTTLHTTAGGHMRRIAAKWGERGERAGDALQVALGWLAPCRTKHPARNTRDRLTRSKRALARETPNGRAIVRARRAGFERASGRAGKRAGGRARCACGRNGGCGRAGLSDARASVRAGTRVGWLEVWG